MKKYILEYDHYDEVIALLGHEIPHSNLEHVTTIIVDLHEEEFNAIKEAGYKIIENIIPTEDGMLAFPENIPFWRSYPTKPNYVNSYLKIPEARLAGFDGTGVKVALLGSGCLDANLPYMNSTTPIIRQDYCGVGLNYDAFNHESKGCMIILQNKSFFAGTANTEGSAFGCQLYSMTTFYGGSATYITAINYCIANGIDIINTAIRGLGTSIDTAIAAAIAAGIIVVCAAGNTTYDTIVDHGLVPGSVTVNGVAYNNALNPFGSYLTSDGHVGITATFYSEGHYEYRTGGTSQVSFHIAALMAIYKQKYPSMNSHNAVNLLKRRALKMDTRIYDKPSLTTLKGGVTENYVTGAGFIAPLY